MMDEAKLSRILKSMEEHDVPQLIMSDPLAIYYLLGKKFAPGERMLVLYLMAVKVSSQTSGIRGGKQIRQWFADR